MDLHALSIRRRSSFISFNFIATFLDKIFCYGGCVCNFVYVPKGMRYSK